MLKENLTLRGARLIDPQTGLDRIADIRIEGGRIAEIGDNLTESGEALDLAGKVITPGLVDIHTHLREPGREDTETIASGCAAAAAGGFTRLACMPNTNPPIDKVGVIDLIKRQAAPHPAHIHPIAAVTQNREGKKLADMYELAAAGAVGFSDDGSPVADTDILRRALEYVKDFGGVIVEHAEDPYLFKGVMHEGLTSTRLGLEGIPSLCETVMVERDIRLAEFTGGRLHICHISAAETVELVRAAKKAGIKVTAEVTPHHLFLNDSAVMGYNTNAKVNPPLRTEKDRLALVEGLLDGTIDCIATDHAPHAPEEKEDDFNTAPFGVIGLETALGLILTELVHTGRLDWSALVDRMSIAPRRILNLPSAKIEAGAEAELTIIDPEAEWKVEPAKFKSLSRNTPFAGRTLKGKAWGIYSKGRLAWNVE